MVAAITRTSTLTGWLLAEAVHFVRFEKAQKLGLEVRPDLGDLVEEERAAGGAADDAFEARVRRR